MMVFFQSPDPAFVTFKSDPTIIESCQYEYWTNTSYIKPTRINNTVENVSFASLFKVCYTRDGNATKTFVKDYSNISLNYSFLVDTRRTGSLVIK